MSVLQLTTVHDVCDRCGVTETRSCHPDEAFSLPYLEDWSPLATGLESGPLLLCPICAELWDQDQADRLDDEFGWPDDDLPVPLELTPSAQLVLGAVSA